MLMRFGSASEAVDCEVIAGNRMAFMYNGKPRFGTVVDVVKAGKTKYSLVDGLRIVRIDCSWLDLQCDIDNTVQRYSLNKCGVPSIDSRIYPIDYWQQRKVM